MASQYDNMATRSKRLYRVKGVRDGLRVVRDYQSKGAAEAAASKWREGWAGCGDLEGDDGYPPAQDVTITRSAPIVWEAEQ